jgi:hypothetical protein
MSTSCHLLACVLLAVVLTTSVTAGETRPAEERPLLERIAGRTFPSVFMAWNPADNLSGEDPLTTTTRHDLLFGGAHTFRLRWDHEHQGLATGFTPDSRVQGLQLRRELLARNPAMVLLMEVRYRDAWGPKPPKQYAESWGPWRGYLPDDHAWWKRDASGTPMPGWEEGGFLLLDMAAPAWRAQVVQQCRAAVVSGVVDGVMLDWWEEDDDRIALVTAIRAAIGDEALILVNANDRRIPRTAALVNGIFMECYRSRDAANWPLIQDTLVWAEQHLRQPRINCLETWFPRARSDLDRMRATTALAMTLSDGYCLFADPNPLPTPDHLHDWYPFWDRKVGTPLAPGARRADGSVVREFAGGTVLFNPPGNPPVTIRFPAPRTSIATGVSASEHRVAGGDGDCFVPEAADGGPGTPP